MSFAPIVHCPRLFICCSDTSVIVQTLRIWIHSLTFTSTPDVVTHQTRLWSENAQSVVYFLLFNFDITTSRSARPRAIINAPKRHCMRQELTSINLRMSTYPIPDVGFDPSNIKPDDYWEMVENFREGWVDHKPFLYAFFEFIITDSYNVSGCLKELLAYQSRFVFFASSLAVPESLRVAREPFSILVSAEIFSFLPILSKRSNADSRLMNSSVTEFTITPWWAGIRTCHEWLVLKQFADRLD